MRSILNFSVSLKKINGNCINLLGEFYYHGIHVTKDNKKAFELYKEAVDQDNNLHALHNVGYMYYYGFGVEQDNKLGNTYNISIKYHTMAADAGYCRSQSWLGSIYVHTNIIKTIKYYTLAIKQNDLKAKKAFDKILKENRSYAPVNYLMTENNKLKEENDALKIQVEELELMPEGPKYKEAKDHFNLLAKSLE
jgi:TPR repeat protein